MNQLRTRIYIPGLISRNILDEIEQFLYPTDLSERSIYRKYNSYSHHIVVFNSHRIIATLRVIDGSKPGNVLPIEYARTISGEFFKINRPTCEIGGFKIAQSISYRTRYAVLQKIMDITEYYVYKIGAESAWITCKPNYRPLYSRYKFSEKARIYYSDEEYSALYRKAYPN